MSDDYLTYQAKQQEVESLNLKRIAEIESERLAEDEGEDEEISLCKIY